MTLKQKSILISVGTTIFFVFIITFVIYTIVLTEFQEIENQRAERNVRRVSAILDDRANQINEKLSDWAIWDDTYKFMTDRNENYIKTNLTQESFSSTNIDEAIFIDKNGTLITSFLLEKFTRLEHDFPEDLYEHFSTGSALTKFSQEAGFGKGILKTDDGLILYAIRNVYKSDGSGEPNGQIVFARYFDEKILNSLKELTQFEASVFAFDDPNMPSDFILAKNNFTKTGNKDFIYPLSKDTISGYLVVEDSYSVPQLIVRTDIGREIYNQGNYGLYLLIVIMSTTGIAGAGMNYFLLTKVVLGRILTMASDVDKLGQSKIEDDRLKIGSSVDELDNLRRKINEMLDSIQSSKTELSNKEEFINIVMDRLSIGIAVNKISNGKTIYMNKAFEEIYGWSRDELTDVDSFFTKVYPDQKVREDLKKRVLEDIKSGDPNRMHWTGLEITKRDGEKGYIDARNIPLTDQDLMVSTVEDITLKEKEEEKRERYAKELEKLNDVMVDREIRMIQLKKQLEKLKEKS